MVNSTRGNATVQQNSVRELMESRKSKRDVKCIITKADKNTTSCKHVVFKSSM